MTSWIVPSDSHSPGDTGHTTDHNHIADDLTILMPAVSVAATVYVTAAGNDSNNGLSWGTAFATISAAIAALPTVGGVQAGIVEVGYGSFAPFSVTNTQVPWVRGRGMGQSYDATNNQTSPQHPTVILQSGGDGIDVTGPTTYGPTGGVAPYGVVISDLAIVGNGSTAGTALKVKSTSFVTVRNVVFDNWATWGQWFQRCYGGLMENCFTTRCGTVGATTPAGGLFMDPSAGEIDGLLFVNCEWFENSGFGAYNPSGSQTAGITFDTCDFEKTAASSASLSGQGFYGKGGSYLFLNPWCEANAAYGTYLDAGSQAAVYGGMFPGDSVQVAGIYMAGNALDVHGARFLGNTGTASINNTNENFVTWSGCQSSDTAWIDNGGGGTIAAAAAALTGTAEGAVLSGMNVQSSSGGTVTFDVSFGNIQPVTITGNVTSSSIANPSAGQVVTIAWVQGAGGSHTYAWPANCKFAAGTAPAASTTAGYTDSVTFYYNGTNWIETSRAVGVH